MNFEKGKIIAILKDTENEKKRSKKKENKNLYVDDKAKWNRWGLFFNNC